MATAAVLAIAIVLALLLIGGILAGALVQSPDRRKHAAATVIIIILAILAVVVPLMIVFRTVKIFQLYDEVVNALTAVVGLNRYLVTGLVLIGFLPYGFLLRWLFSLNSLKRKVARRGIVVYIAAFNLAMFFLTKDMSFRHDTGQSTKWYAITPEGCRYFDSPGFDPKYGIRLSPVTPDTKRECDRIQSGLASQAVTENAAYFDPITGDTLVYYCRKPSGEIELSNGPGYDSKLGIKRVPITTAIVLEYQQQIEEARRLAVSENEQIAKKKALEQTAAESEHLRRSLINPPFHHNGQNTTDLLLIVPQSTGLIMGTYMSGLRRVGFTPFATSLTAKFDSGGYRAALMNGDGSVLTTIRAGDMADYILAMDYQERFSQDTRLAGLKTCNLSLNFQLYSADSKLIRGSPLTATEIGTSDELAAAKCHRIISDSLCNMISGLVAK